MKQWHILFIPILCASMAFFATPATASDTELDRVDTYVDGIFTDVTDALWCADNVKAAYEFGLMRGMTDTTFDTTSDLSIAQTITMACRIHRGFNGIEEEYSAGDPWYQSSLEYASEYGIVYQFDDYNAPATRAEFAQIMASAVTDTNIPVINKLEDGIIPDVAINAPYYDDVYRLYNAGILRGSDAYGSFTPNNHITRGEAAAIVTRIADPSLRLHFVLEEKPFTPVPVSQLQNLASLKRGCTVAEFQAAYDAAAEIVAPLANVSLEEQLYGVAVYLRQMYEMGLVEYSTSAPHFSDPYGYLVSGAASCAGCTKATGLCLNILGIPYEHVNEDQWSHQWCRVNVNGTYWICDAYGLYCGPEPAPYVHPWLS